MNSRISDQPAAVTNEMSLEISFLGKRGGKKREKGLWAAMQLGNQILGVFGIRIVFYSPQKILESSNLFFGSIFIRILDYLLYSLQSFISFEKSCHFQFGFSLFSSNGTTTNIFIEIFYKKSIE